MLEVEVNSGLVSGVDEELKLSVWESDGVDVVGNSVSFGDAIDSLSKGAVVIEISNDVAVIGVGDEFVVSVVVKVVSGVAVVKVVKAKTLDPAEAEIVEEGEEVADGFVVAELVEEGDEVADGIAVNGTCPVEIQTKIHFQKTTEKLLRKMSRNMTLRQDDITTQQDKTQDWTVNKNVLHIHKIEINA